MCIRDSALTVRGKCQYVFSRPTKWNWLRLTLTLLSPKEGVERTILGGLSTVWTQDTPELSGHACPTDVATCYVRQVRSDPRLPLNVPTSEWVCGENAIACPTDRSWPRISCVTSVPMALRISRLPPGCRWAKSETSTIAPSINTQLCPFRTYRGDDFGETL